MNGNEQKALLGRKMLQGRTAGKRLFPIGTKPAHAETCGGWLACPEGHGNKSRSMLCAPQDHRHSERENRAELHPGQGENLHRPAIGMNIPMNKRGAVVEPLKNDRFIGNTVAVLFLFAAKQTGICRCGGFQFRGPLVVLPPAGFISQVWLIGVCAVVFGLLPFCLALRWPTLKIRIPSLG